MALTFGRVSGTGSAATTSPTQRAVTQFDNPVVLQGVVLKGTYLFVHDDAAMKRGEACSRIYKGDTEVANKLVASFHCIHVERTRAAKFTVRTAETTPGMMELREFQFAGDTAGHGVPPTPLTAVIPLAN